MKSEFNKMSDAELIALACKKRIPLPYYRGEGSGIVVRQKLIQRLAAHASRP